MSILNYLFDSEWSRRSDIEALKEQHSSLGSSLGLERLSEVVQEDRVRVLDQQIGDLALLTKTLMRILVEKGVCTGREIEDMMHQVDLEDGSADGRVTKSGEAVPGRCPECDHLVQSHRERCLYCGHELSPDVREGTPDAEEVLIDLYDNATRGLLGQIPESQLHFLMDHLEVTAASDRDYYLDPATLVMLEERGAAEALVRGLRNALGEREGMEVRWEEAQESTGLLHEALEVVQEAADSSNKAVEDDHDDDEMPQSAEGALAQPESSPSPQPQSANLDMKAVCEELFSMSVETNRLFEDKYQGTTITWSGILHRADRCSYDTVFGSEPCTKAVFETHELAEGVYGARKVQAVVQLPLDVLDDLRARVGEEVSFEGTLTSCDSFMRNLFLKDGQLEMDA